MHRPIRSALAASFLACVMVFMTGSPSHAAPAADEPVVTATLTEVPSENAAHRSQPDERTDGDPAEARQKRAPKETPQELRQRAELAQKFRAKREQRTDDGVSQLSSRSAVDCQQVPGASDADGLVLDHFNWCHVGRYNLVLTECDWLGCRSVGTANFRLSTLGTGTNGARTISFVSYMDEITYDGEAGAEPLTLDIKCTVFQGSACNADPLNKQTQTMGQWKASPSAFFNFSSPATGSVGTDLISWYDFEGIVDIPRDDAVTTGANGFRCDSATYPAQKQGCVFDQTQELWYDLSTSNPDVNESAQHIVDAQERPELTLPSWTGKTVPGGIYSGEPLTRVYYNTTLRDANRAKARATCQQYWPNYSTFGQDCDEYPFSTTLQGAAAGDDRYSARALDSADNQRAGSWLGAFYNRQRVLEDDSFYVIVIQ